MTVYLPMSTKCATCLAEIHQKTSVWGSRLQWKFFCKTPQSWNQPTKNGVNNSATRLKHEKKTETQA